MEGGCCSGSLMCGQQQVQSELNALSYPFFPFSGVKRALRDVRVRNWRLLHFLPEGKSRRKMSGVKFALLEA